MSAIISGNATSYGMDFNSTSDKSIAVFLIMGAAVFYLLRHRILK